MNSVQPRRSPSRTACAPGSSARPPRARGRALAGRRARAGGRAPCRCPRGSARRTSRSVDVVAVLREQAADERGRVVGGVDERLARAATSAPRPCRRPGGRAARRCRRRRSGRSARMRIRSASFSASSRSCVVSRIVVRSRSDEAVHEVVELAPRVRVEAGRRLVEEQQLGPADDADRDVEPAALAAGQRARSSGRRARRARPSRAARRRRTGAGRRASSTARSSRRAARAAAAASSAGGRATTAARRRCAPASPRRRGPGPRRARVTSPAERIRKPSRISIVVVLPAPFGPSRQTTSPRRTSKSTPVEHVRAAVAHPQVAHLDDDLVS